MNSTCGRTPVRSALAASVCVCTSITSVCVCDGTHSSASSEQQPPQRRSVTHDGRKRWCVSHGNSRQTSTSVSLGWHPLFWYTSNHLTTDRKKINERHSKKTNEQFRFGTASETLNWVYINEFWKVILTTCFITNWKWHYMCTWIYYTLYIHINIGARC